MTTPEVELRAAWHDVAGPAHPALLDHLLARHREAHRRYHTTAHVMWVLRHIAHIAVAGLDPSVDLDAVRLAALYHDVVYDPGRTDNEAASADLAEHAAIELGWPADRCATVHRLVMSTAAHHPIAPDEAVLVDADLAILGAEPKDYTAYIHAIRLEYAYVRPEEWRVGRSQVLREFLDAPRVFHTEVMHRELESRAKANVAAELATLAGPVGLA